MRDLIKAGLVALVLSLSLAAPVLAGPYEDADAAYFKGDYTTALRLYRPLAEQGNAEAQYSLGVMYDNGQGVTQNYAEAVKWYRKAADQGDARAQFNLGIMYAKGEGVPQDYVQAHKWVNLAAGGFPASESGSRNVAVILRDNVAAEMTAAQIAKAQELASAWKPK